MEKIILEDWNLIPSVLIPLPFRLITLDGSFSVFPIALLWLKLRSTSHLRNSSKRPIGGDEGVDNEGVCEVGQWEAGRGV